MKNFKIKLLVLFIVIFSIIPSCSTEPDPIVATLPPTVNEGEVITTVKLVLEPVGGGTTITLISKDLDGPVGPIAPIISGNTIPFAQNKTYNGSISVLNESVSPVIDITPEIVTEARDHQFFYQNLGTLPALTYTPAAIAPTNFDSNGKPLGIKTTFVTTTAATGSIKVILLHNPELSYTKSGVGVATGNIANAIGETDFDITFTGLIVQ